ncbi:putative ABC transporter ATP-binding protein [Listeria monocytogenes]|nr:putative ABC transporter ATP-binding protein [Listeria monocytogenes]
MQRLHHHEHSNKKLCWSGSWKTMLTFFRKANNAFFVYASGFPSK